MTAGEFLELALALDVVGPVCIVVDPPPPTEGADTMVGASFGRAVKNAFEGGLIGSSGW